MAFLLQLFSGISNSSRILVPLYTDIFVELWGVGLLRDNKDIVNGV
jgi:hypothetical protein